MSRISSFSIAAVVACMLSASIVNADTFNGSPDVEDDSHGFYYTISGGKFPTGTTPNGDNGSGGTYRFITDDPAWGHPTQTWQKDDWFASNAGIAVTLKNGAAIVYDNNGLEAGAASAADPGFYNAANYDPSNPNNPGAGAVTAYSMSNNYDWIYAGYMKLTQATTITQLIGYFAYSGTNDALTFNFNPNDPAIGYHVNIFSNVAGLPANTGSFAGDVFTSDTTAGSFAWSDTGYDRIGSSSTQSIYRLQYTLDAPITLQAGEYWFSHDASITATAAVVPLPAAAWMGIALVGGVGGVRGLRNRRIRESLGRAIMMNRCFLSAAVALALLSAATARAESLPAAVDGAIGSEWTGANTIEIGYDANAPIGNFGTPGTTSHAVAYDILTRQDADFLYVGLQTDSARGGSASSAINSANLYFGGELNKTIGFEVTNNRAFVAGVPGYYDLSSLDSAYQIVFGTDFSSAEKTIEVAVPIAFFADDPFNMGFTKLDGSESANFTRLNLSQSFGYSVAGGQINYGDNRLGGFTISPAAAPVPLPAAAWMGMALIGGMGGVRSIRRRLSK